MNPQLILMLAQASPELIDDLIALLQAYRAFMVKFNALTGTKGP